MDGRRSAASPCSSEGRAASSSDDDEDDEDDEDDASRFGLRVGGVEERTGAGAAADGAGVSLASAVAARFLVKRSASGALSRPWKSLAGTPSVNRASLIKGTLMAISGVLASAEDFLALFFFEICGPEIRFGSGSTR